MKPYLLATAIAIVSISVGFGVGLAFQAFASKPAPAAAPTSGEIDIKLPALPKLGAISPGSPVERDEAILIPPNMADRYTGHGTQSE